MSRDKMLPGPVRWTRHALSRMSERLGVSLTAAEREEIAALIAAGGGILTHQAYGDGQRERRMVTVRGEPVVLVYAHQDRTIVTILDRSRWAMNIAVKSTAQSRGAPRAPSRTAPNRQESKRQLRRCRVDPDAADGSDDPPNIHGGIDQ